MDRRDFLMVGMGGALAPSTWIAGAVEAGPGSDSLRAAFPIVGATRYLNAAGMMPLSSFGREALARYVDYQTLGPESKEVEFVGKVKGGVRARFAKLVGADVDEIGLVQCTKAGEQIVLDAVDDLRPGGNIVTNELHFAGSLHNLAGLARAGRDVRVVRATDWRVPVEAMAEAIDERTAVVALSLVSNVNGHIADVAALTQVAHERGALVYADIIQAAGIVPLDLHALGVDVAACSCFKWLFGVYGSGFLYVRQDLQGQRLPDRLFPGHLQLNRAPWVHEVDPDAPEERFRARHDATRYQPGHVNYLGYCAAYAGLDLLERVGVDVALAHSVALNRRLVAGLDPERFECISPDLARSPIATFVARDPQGLEQRLARAGVVVSLTANRLRVSPGLFNDEADIDALLEALGA